MSYNPCPEAHLIRYYTDGYSVLHTQQSSVEVWNVKVSLASSIK